MWAKRRNPCLLCSFPKDLSQRPTIQSVPCYLPTLADGHKDGPTNPRDCNPSFQHSFGFSRYIGQPNLVDEKILANLKNVIKGIRNSLNRASATENLFWMVNLTAEQPLLRIV